MHTTKLTSKGQVIIPKSLRTRYHLHAGQELTVVDTGEGLLLKPVPVFQATEVSQVAGMLKSKYSGKPISQEDMEDAIRKGVMERQK